MAGEIIQAVLMPLDKPLEELKSLLSEADFQVLSAAKAEKHDDLTKYTLVEEAKFEKLEAVDLGNTGIKVLFGALKEAAKADSMGMIVMPPSHTMDYWANRDEMGNPAEPFCRVLERKVDALRQSTIAAIELKDSFDAINVAVNTALDDFALWVTGAIAELRVQQEAAAKADANKPGIVSRVARLFNRQAAKTDTPKGESEMTPEEIKETFSTMLDEKVPQIVEEAVNKIAAKADSEEAKKAETEAKAAREAEYEALKSAVEELKELKTKLAEKSETDADKDAGKVKELEAVKAELAAAQENVKSLAEKMEALERSPGPATSPEDKARENAEKYDAANPYQTFNVIPAPARA